MNLDATPQGSKLVALVLLVADSMRGDTQEIEGINSQIRMIGNRCPRIDLLHLSSRIALKHSMRSTEAGKHKTLECG